MTYLVELLLKERESRLRAEAGRARLAALAAGCRRSLSAVLFRRCAPAGCR